MDVVIPLSSKHNFNTSQDNSFAELRYALRSLEKNLSGVDRVFIVGEYSGLPGVNYIPCDDPFPHKDKEKNIYHKLKAACRHVDISEDFLFTNDDIILQAPHQADTFPFYCKGDLEEGIARRTDDDPYKEAMINTIRILRCSHYTSYHFDVHSPIIYNKTRFMNIMNSYDWSIPRGYVIKSLYANTACIQGEYLEDVKFKWPLTRPAILRRINGKQMFSTDDAAMNDSFIEILQEQFPNPSRWE